LLASSTTTVAVLGAEARTETGASARLRRFPSLTGRRIRGAARSRLVVPAAMRARMLVETTALSRSWSAS
jgi:hypothetical protein